ncbi:uncharacterized protein BX663DRAFT_494176 [Cokeromyces recurvatus]|uniref:uncharacterized protein n=1 Tax=Cokeromyces recurvatus TaxID=90255 RepID=UPI002220CD56|nr:uncharacterized protein BX663DRAFT_494176 [Cokeromyces recurvatus]KAI7906911.1 hypothetical protein BX663DRAFT_494176 [Cokeromyces recurvatus]
MTFDFEEIPRDLLSSIAPTDSIVIGISEDVKLPCKGVSAIFRQRYANHLLQVQAQRKTLGQIAMTIHEQRHIFYLIMRHKLYNKPRFIDLETCLIELRKSCERNGIKTLALSREQGTGFEGFPEKHMKELLFTVFDGWHGKLMMYTGS